MSEAGLFQRRSAGDPLVFSIPGHRSFADALATGLVSSFAGAPLALANGRVLLPNNRAVRTLTEAFVRVSGNGLVLPRLIAIGDPEIGERIGGALDPIGQSDDVPPAIEAGERLILLANMLRREGESAAETLRLAAELALTMDALAVEEIDPGCLRDAVADTGDLAAHWQHSFERFDDVLRRWPAILAKRGQVELAERRSRLLHALAKRWEDTSPDGFTIAAGITTSAPAIAAVLRSVSRLERGAVVLPAVPDERTLSTDEWDALGPDEDGRGEETHPAYHLKRLLERIGVSRHEVGVWRWGGRAASPAVRGRAIAHAMVAADFSDKWNWLPAPERRLTGVQVAEFPDPASEAQAIAIALRQSVETPGQTAALVTPDRLLAARVSAHLARWGIEADDSAGQPLSSAPAGTLLLAIAAVMVEGVAPVPLLAVLKHPLVGGEGEARLGWLDRVRSLDLALRGPRPAPGLASLDAHIASYAKEKKRAQAVTDWQTLRPAVEPFAAPFVAASLSQLAVQLRTHVDAIAGDAAWRGADGRMAAELLAELEQSPDASTFTVGPDDLLPILRQFMDAMPVRRPYGGHPRIFIWGLLEARLQKADLMILGGMNEGVWPTLPTPDPWLAPRIRRDLGLPGLEFRTGLAAHDFMSALGAPRVLLTRARRDSRSPTIASRFWLRLQAMTGGMTRNQRLERLARAVDASAEVVPVGRPKPAPPTDARPNRIAVTDLDRLKADPFAFYAKAVLRLRKEDPVDADQHAAWKGTAVHQVLQDWFDHDAADPAKLMPRLEAMLADEAIHPMLRALWGPRLREAVEWIAAQMADDLAAGRRPVLAEKFGEAAVAGVTLFGKVDRIDRLADGSLAIVDYKTGQAPRPKAVEEGFALQLGLLALIARAGGFPGIAGDIGAHEYWSLAKKNGKLGYRAQPDEADGPQAFHERAFAQFAAAAEAYLLGTEPFVAKLNPAYAPYDDYDQLMRLEEWYGRE